MLVGGVKVEVGMLGLRRGVEAVGEFDFSVARRDVPRYIWHYNVVARILFARHI